MKLRALLPSLAVALTAVTTLPVQAHAQWWHSFYKVSVAGSDSHQPSGAPCCSNLRQGWVNNTLNANWRPTLSAAGAAYAGSNAISGAAGSQIEFWQNLGVGGAVTFESSGFGHSLFSTASFNTGDNFFVSGQPNNGTFQRAAHLVGVATNAGSSSWTLLGDDDAWLFINGQLVLDNGGVKAFTASQATTSTVTWDVGDRIDIFFADRMWQQSQLSLVANGLTISGVDPNVPQVPEPASLLLLLTGAATLAVRARRRLS